MCKLCVETEHTPVPSINIDKKSGRSKQIFTVAGDDLVMDTE